MAGRVHGLESVSGLVQNFVGNGVVRLACITEKSGSGRKQRQMGKPVGLNTVKQGFKAFDLGCLDRLKIVYCLVFNTPVRQNSRSVDYAGNRSQFFNNRCQLFLQGSAVNNISTDIFGR